MIRLLIGSAVSVLGVGLSAAFVAPILDGVPGGEPLVVAGPASGAFQQADFEGSPCPSTLLLTDRDDLKDAPTPPPAGQRIFAITLGAGADASGPAVHEFAFGEAPEGAGIVLIVDADGRVIFAGGGTEVPAHTMGAGKDCPGMTVTGSI